VTHISLHWFEFTKTELHAQLFLEQIIILGNLMNSNYFVFNRCAIDGNVVLDLAIQMKQTYWMRSICKDCELEFGPEWEMQTETDNRPWKFVDYSSLYDLLMCATDGTQTKSVMDHSCIFDRQIWSVKGKWLNESGQKSWEYVLTTQLRELLQGKWAPHVHRMHFFRKTLTGSRDTEKWAYRSDWRRQSTLSRQTNRGC
jgi:hypothetical protein